MKVTAACIQTNATSDMPTNFARIEPMIIEARQRGAEFIALPENVSLIVKGREKIFAAALPEAQHPATAFFAQMARTTKAWILAGSVAVATGEDRLANRSLLFDPAGNVAARYDKIHMFDAFLSDKETYRESENFASGNKAVLAATPFGKIGMTVCYDVRFPHLYRSLAKGGADIITIPAAFTATTGALHWHVLNRARAIETGCFVLSPAQCGTHDAGRQTDGHSLIIAPDGKILAEAGDEPGIILTELDLAKVTVARSMLPSLQHDREFVEP